MTMTVTAFVTWTCVAIAQTAPAASDHQAWLKGFEGTWVIDGASGSDADLVLTIVSEANHLVLNTVLGGRKIQTRYDYSGADVTNTNFGGKAGQSSFTRVHIGRIVFGGSAEAVGMDVAVGAASQGFYRLISTACFNVSSLAPRSVLIPRNRRVGTIAGLIRLSAC